MYKIMLQKILHKKWINLCLMLGSMLLIATVVSFPLYRAAAYDRMLQDEFRNRTARTGQWQTMLEISTTATDLSTVERVEGMVKGLEEQLGVTMRKTVAYYSISPTQALSQMNREDAGNISLRLSAMTDLPEHVEMLSGEMYSDTGLTEDGCVEVIVSQECMVGQQLLVGETLVYGNLKGADGNPLRICVTGVYEAADRGDFYWQTESEKMNNVCLMNETLFSQLFLEDRSRKVSMTCNYYPMFEYEDLTVNQLDRLVSETRYLTEESPFRKIIKGSPYLETIDAYLLKKARIEATLTILQIPVLILLGAFLFMISEQMYDTEQNEISVIKSRGSSGGQIFRLYVYQCTLLALLGCVFGIPLGTVFSRILGAASNFLEFDNNRMLTIVFNREALIYTLGAMLVTLLVMTVPAIRHSRLTIVKLKQKKAGRKRGLWEKLFLDVILIGVSLYGYYNFSRNADSLSMSVLEGKSLDPLLYISSSLFIVGMGLLFLRVQPLLVRLIYFLGKRFWRPASYVSFMENQKNGRKQQFIMLFLILTISLGMYHATVARTILRNAWDNAEYLDGADIILQEVWRKGGASISSSTGETVNIRPMYREPDYDKYASAEFADSYTRVINDTNASVKVTAAGAYQGTTLGAQLMGIHTREFGANTWIPSSLTGKHYYTLLNELAVEKNGILVSENFRSQLGYAVGDKVDYQDSNGNKATGTIVDFFEYFPGYLPSYISKNAEGASTSFDRYLVVAHYNELREAWGVTPYEIWITLKEGCDSSDVYAWLEANDIAVSKYTDREADIQDTVEDPLLQGTNGVLTMGFLVTILLCAVGYLIYWVMSIRSREMVFGVLRASGMHRGELFHMLMNEQIFSGVFSVLAGIGIGWLTSVMFVPILQLAYASENQALPMKLVMNLQDMERLYFVIAATMILCLAVLILLIFKMNVTKALKLGEE